MDYCDLRSSINLLASKNRFRFHMPGHKGLCLADTRDLTELPGLDNLHRPQGVLKRSQQQVANIYGAAHTYFLVNGTSVGLLAGMVALLAPGDLVLVERNCHKAIISGLVHTGAMPIYLEQRYCFQRRVWLPPEPEIVEAKMAAHSFGAAIFTNPNYFGLVPNLKRIVACCRQFKVPLLIDEAHGAHLVFGRRLGLPASGIEFGADIVVQSAHKTLTAHTQAAWMHLCNPDLEERLQQALNLFHTTSPSYPLLASLEGAAEFASQHGQLLLRRLRLMVNIINMRCAQLGLDCWPSLQGRDWTRLIIERRKGSEKVLRSRGIWHELSQDGNLLFILSMADAADPRGLVALYKTLPAIAGLPDEMSKPLALPPSIEQACSPREAWLLPGKIVKLDDAEGKICREIIAPYPPGTLVAAPGQILNRENIEFLSMLNVKKVIPEWINII